MDESPHTKHMFYWLVGAEGADFETAPTVLWLTGGPGCSSLLALFTENGPFRHSEESVFELVRNNYSWNKAGVNMLFLESPVGVGFSWAEDGNYTTGDNETARVSQLFLRGFFQQFPQLAKNDFYISGESYAVSCCVISSVVTSGMHAEVLPSSEAATGNLPLRVETVRRVTTFPSWHRR